MDVLEAVKGRRSIRRFQRRGIPDEMINRLVEALIWAPSAGNLQSRKFYFITDDRLKVLLSKAALNQSYVSDAPLVIVCCTDRSIASRYGGRGVELYSIQDVSCSVMCMMLVAHEMGLGSVWVGAFDEGEVSRILNLPENLRPVAIVPVGWPDRVPSAPQRVRPDEAVVRIGRNG
jgi:nitroreductase